jgi:D-sedoheptulose 7-phosphate isomerase
MSSFLEIYREHLFTMEQVLNLTDQIEKAVGLVATTINQGGKVLTAGNGGSASDAMHFSSELIGRLDINRRSYPSICLSADPSVLTCISNDYGYGNVFRRQLEGLITPNDCFIGFSSSGQSENILNALEYVKTTGAKSISFLGKGGGRCKGLADVEVIVESNSTARIQEAHIVITHAVCKMAQDRIENKIR